jgi:hypothetical protein
LEYKPNINDVQIADGWAIEVGDFGAIYQLSAKDDPSVSKTKECAFLSGKMMVRGNSRWLV